MNAADIGRGHFSRKIGVLGKIFEVAAAAGVALHAGAGAEKDVDVEGRRLFAERRTELLAERLVPAVCHCRRRGIARCGNAWIETEVVCLACLTPKSVGAVRQEYAWYALALDLLRLPEVLARQQICFFTQGEPAYKLFRVHFFASLAVFLRLNIIYYLHLYCQHYSRILSVCAHILILSLIFTRIFMLTAVFNTFCGDKKIPPRRDFCADL